MKKIILDTNFLIYCAENKIDYVTEIARLMTEGYELFVPFQVVHELEDLYKKGKKFSDRSAAWIALKILRSNNVKTLTASGRTADEAILNLVRIGSIIATLDLELRQKLAGTRVIVVQGNKKLAFE